MTESILSKSNNINNLARKRNKDDIFQIKKIDEDEQQFYDSQRSSTSTSTINENNDNLGINSKFLLNKLKVLENFQHQYLVQKILF